MVIDVLDWILDVLKLFPEEKEALMEAEWLQEYLGSIPKSKSNYGLVHYDFEYDNVFYDNETKSCNVIDFDDSMYHWYAMDILQAQVSLQDYISAELCNHKKQCFIEGYLTEYEITNNTDDMVSACTRFADLYSYVRTLRATSEKWEHEPEWLINLREKLNLQLSTRTY
jgi:Ser/Thr protein kinase RdoA (MazF antagonist)